MDDRPVPDEREGAGRVHLAVSDARQWSFCPRVLWHRRMMPHRTQPTAKMGLGNDAQAALEKLEARRTGHRYGLAAATHRFGVRLTSRRLAVSGTCDLVLDVPASDTEPRRLYPVEVKRTEGGASEHHRVQVAGYAMLLEEQEGLEPGSADRGFLVLLPSEDVVVVETDARLRAAFERSIAEIREMLDRERFPPPTEHRGFCPQCEYVRFCGDVL